MSQRTIKSATIAAIRRSDIRPMMRLRLRLMLALRPEAMSAVAEFIILEAAEREPTRFAALCDCDDLAEHVFSEVDWQYILDLIIEYLPMIIQLILLFI